MTSRNAQVQARMVDFIPELRSLGIHNQKVFAFHDQETGCLMLAILYVPDPQGHAVLITDHNTHHSGAFLVHRSDGKTQYHPLTIHSGLGRALELARQNGWDVKADEHHPSNPTLN